MALREKFFKNDYWLKFFPKDSEFSIEGNQFSFYYPSKKAPEECCGGGLGIIIPYLDEFAELSDDTIKLDENTTITYVTDKNDKEEVKLTRMVKKGKVYTDTKSIANELERFCLKYM